MRLLKFCALNRRLRWDVVAAVLTMWGYGWMPDASAQTNNWTGSASGYWESPNWSLGVLPGTNQTILFTNTGWKALGITANTAQNFPQTLNVDSITVSSPTNSFNTLLLSYAGFQTPLKVNALTVGNNSAVTMLSSALQLNGPNGSGMSIAGTFNQSDSVVTGNQIDVGYIGPGVYNFNSGLLNVGHLFLEGNFGGIFYQNGGANSSGIVHLDGGTYVFQDGSYSATNTYFNGGTFLQQGGSLYADLAVFRGSYHLAGGVHYGTTTIPWHDNFGPGDGSMLQTGGTNFGALDIGTYGDGAYNLVGGVLAIAGLGVNVHGSFNQSGGSTIVTGTVSTRQAWIARNDIASGSVELNGGTFSAAAMSIDGDYAQTGGTNTVAGGVTLSGGPNSSINLSGGRLSDNGTSISASCWGGYRQSGGVHVIADQLSVVGNGLWPWQGFLLSGGQLSVSNIVVTSLGGFTLTGGTINQSGMLTAANAYFSFGSGTWQFGPLQLNSGGDSHSLVYMQTGSGNVHFGDSHSLGWSNQATLIIENWSGSLYGGGGQRILFGNSGASLNVSQLKQIQFRNPANLAAGTYPARLLATGEIVPDALLFAGHNGLQPVLSWSSGWTLQTTTNLAEPFIDLESATSPYTNRFTDPQRFFRLSAAHSMALIAAGAFTMGDTLDGLGNAIPVGVTVSAFYMDLNLVRLSQWQSVYGYATNHGYNFANAGSGKTANHPVHTVDWYDCVKWSNARSQQAGLTPVYYTDAGLTQVFTNGEHPTSVYPNWAASGYRLPTEAEWEKAARGGLSGQRFPWGNLIGTSQANYNGSTNNFSYDLGPNGYNIAFTNGVLPYTSLAGYFPPNGFGLYDMAGNVSEWCWDWYGTPYAGGSDPHGATWPAIDRVLRGGSWNYLAGSARCANRGFTNPKWAAYDIGFRCVRGL